MKFRTSNVRNFQGIFDEFSTNFDVITFAQYCKWKPCLLFNKYLVLDILDCLNDRRLPVH